MFTRIMKQKNKDGSTREYLYIVENKRVNGKITQRTIANLGRLDNEEVSGKTMDALVGSLAKYTEKQKIIELGKTFSATSSKTYGEIVIFRKLWKELKLESLLRKYFEETEKETDVVEAIFAMVCNRLIDPSSKREANEWIKDVYEPKWDGLQLHHFYRAMDFLETKKETMEKELFDTSADLFGCKVDVVMFDTTNISYWGQGDEGELLQYGGNAKNKRNDLKQLTVGIIMDRNGAPLGHEVWPGNMSDKPAFKEIITKIKTKFSIGKVILVCDRGMISEANLSYLEENGYEYIIGAKMRQQSKARQHILLADEGFSEVHDNLLGKSIKEHELWLKEQLSLNAERKREGKSEKAISAEELELLKKSKRGNRTWAVCLNPIVAKEDAEKREYFRKILENKIEFSTAKEWIIRNGYKKYVTIKEMSIELNEERLNEDSLYDGKWVIISNTGLPVESLVRSYKDLYQIERHFRDLKSELEVGPIRHRVDRRISAHIFICFLALQIKFALTQKLKVLDNALSYSEVMRDVAKMKAVLFETPYQAVVQRTAVSGIAYKAFESTGTKVPNEIISIIPKSVVDTSV